MQAGHTRPQTLADLTVDLFDYAGLYPPAGLSPEQAVNEYLRLGRSADVHYLGPFVVDVPRLATILGLYVASGGHKPLPVSLIAGIRQPLLADLDAAFGVLDTDGKDDEVTAGRIVQIETPWPAGLSADAGTFHAWILQLASYDVDRVFLEVLPSSEDLEGIAEAVAQANGFRPSGAAPPSALKLRCGGATPADVPSVSDVIRFLNTCAKFGVPFKATAGLHHPVRSFQEEFGGYMHGFLNLFVAATIRKTRPDIESATLESILVDTDPQSFRFTSTTAAWKDIEVDAAAIGTARRTFSLSIGSCSVAEPAEELAALLQTN